MDEEIHKLLKNYCVKNGLVMKSLVGKLIIDEITKTGNKLTLVKKYPNFNYHECEKSI